MFNFISSGTVISMVSGMFATGSYVAYKDFTRYRRMMSTFATGNILPPMAENNFETVYFRRSGSLETLLQRTLSPTFANEYFLVNGDIGTGKTRMIVELIREMIKNRGARREGAPVYVLANQGKCFPETLAAAVNFNFDEHVGFKFFLDFIMRINSFPHRDDDQRLVRVLDAIEKSSFGYMQRTGRPAVLVIDGINCLQRTMPGALERLQEKAKLWADSNTVKLILVNNDEETEAALHKQSSCSSRLAPAIIVEDLPRDDAVDFLVAPAFMENESLEREPMSAAEASRIVDLVGGRIHHLIRFKRDWTRGVPFELTADELKSRERDKFFRMLRSPSAWRVITVLRDAPGHQMALSELIDRTSMADIYALTKQNLIRYDGEPNGSVIVRFRSRIADKVVDELDPRYEQSS